MVARHNIAPWMYHLHHAQHDEDIAFWLDLAGSLSGPILELGCGTGRILAPLVSAGFPMIGLDINLEMLKYLLAHLEPQLRSRVHIVKADLTECRFSQEFGLIILACNTLSTLTFESRQKAFSRISSHLAPYGRFSASLPNPLMLASLSNSGTQEVEDIYFHPDTANPIQVSSAWERVDQDSVIFRWYYDHLLPDGKVERTSVDVEHTITSIQEYQAELQSAGLSIEHVYGDFDRSPYNTESPYLIFSAGKLD
jgi:SAM-dependent methyltransferase